MKTKLAGILAGLLGLALMSASASAGTINFSDSFNPPSSQWNNYSGNWTASGGQYYATQASNTPSAVTQLPFNLSDFTVTVTANNLTDGGIVLHGNGTSSNAVLLVLGGNGYGQGVRGGTAGSSIYWLDGGANQNEVDGVFTPGSTYNIKVTVVGNVYSAYINGSSTAVSTFTTSLYPTGTVGLYDDQPNTAGGGSGAPMTFSNFSLSGTTVPEPSSLGLLAAFGFALLRRWRSPVGS